MMKKFNYILGACLFLVIASSCNQEKDIQLFDGETFSGWEGSTRAFRIEDNAIVGGNLDNGLDSNFYLCTIEEYSDFELTLSAKFIYTDLENGNAGVYFRAKRTKPDRVGGYEADLGYIKPEVIDRNTDYSPIDLNKPFSLWGSLIDEGREDTSRYPEGSRVVPLKFTDRELIEKIVKPHDWNEIKVIAQGNEIEIKINGVTTVKYTEKGNVSSKGHICLQVHKKPHEIHYKNIQIRKLNIN
jgi:hypothetical protein